MVVSLSGGPCEHVALSSPTTLVGATFDSAFNLRARFYFWARHGQGDPRPRGRSTEGPGCPPGPSEHRFPSSTWERVPWAPRSGGVQLTPRLAVRVAFLPPSNLGPHVGSPGRACDRGLAVARASSLWPGSRPAHASQPRGPRSGMQGSNLSRRQAAPSGACTLWSGIQPPWASVPPPAPPEPMCGMQGGGGAVPRYIFKSQVQHFPFLCR